MWWGGDARLEASLTPGKLYRRRLARTGRTLSSAQGGFRSRAFFSRLLWFAGVFARLRLAQADERASTHPWPPASEGGASPAPAAAESKTEPPAAMGSEGAGTVFHVAPRANDMTTLAENSMQQGYLGAAKTRYAMNIFGDVDFSFGTASNTHVSFALGTLSFLVTGELEKHFVATAEFTFEYNDAANRVQIDIDRLHLGWLGAHFFVYAGRVHTAFGYWNTAYHHGKWLQPNMERPRWVAFEDLGGLLPVHTVGLNAGSNIDVGAGELKVTASVSNGRGNVVDDVRSTFDYQNFKALHAQLEYVGLGVPDLRVGLSGMYDHIAALPGTGGPGVPARPALPDNGIDEYILGAHVAYPGYPLIFVVEAYCVVHRVPSRLFNTYGGFATFGRAFGVVMPYVRGEWIGTSGGTDPFFVPDSGAPAAARFDQVDGLVGLRLDLTDWTALRIEYRATKVSHDDITQLGVVQWSWGF
jgi:hypothetical protein